MLGDQVGEEKGKIKSQRVLDVDPPRMGYIVLQAIL